MRNLPRAAIVVLVLAALLVLLGTTIGGGVVGPGMMGPYGGYRTGNFGGWTWGLGMGLGWLTMIVFWAAIVGSAIWLVTAMTAGSRGTQPREETPLDVLKRRFAAGEITAEDYERMRRTLDL